MYIGLLSRTCVTIPGLDSDLLWNHFKMIGGAYIFSVSIERGRYHMAGLVRFTLYHSSCRSVPGLLRVTEFTFFRWGSQFSGWDALENGVGQFLLPHLHGQLTFTFILVFTCTYTFAGAFVLLIITFTFTSTFTFQLHHIFLHCIYIHIYMFVCDLIFAYIYIYIPIYNRCTFQFCIYIIYIYNFMYFYIYIYLHFYHFSYSH